MKKKNIIHIIYLFILSCVYSATLLLKLFFPNEYFEELLFYFFHGSGKQDILIYIKSILFCLPYALFTFLILLMATHNIFHKKSVDIKIKNKKIHIYPFNNLIKMRKLVTIITSIIIIIFSLNNLSFFDYIKNNITYSNLFEKEYKQASKDDISFNENKKNLIMIYVESLETTLFSKEHGGDWNYEVIPELYDLLNDEDATYFAYNDLATGESNLFGTTYTTASLISNSTGIYFKMPLRYNNYSSGHMLNSVYALGDALKDNGYNEEVISADDTSFGCLDYFYKQHGNADIIDPSSLEKYGYKMSKSDKGAWGFNDRYLYKIAKERILKQASKNEPFIETLIGIDTHHIDGFKGDYTLNKFDSQYENAYATESKLIKEFVDWIKKQDFYENTTVVIVGDHTVMQASMIKGRNPELRKRYNLILNSSVKASKTKNRTFTSVDMYPTVLASMGASIKDDKLGLGINLFSDKETLSEELGLDYLNKEFKKNSKYYNKNIIDAD